MPFSKLGLSDQILRGIRAAGYTSPTSIQEQAIPMALEGRDIIGCAQTGTGKTAAFVLPMLHRLSRDGAYRSGRKVRALILTPTRELAQQVGSFIDSYGRFVPLRATTLIGGVKMEPQIQRLRRQTDIVIATPGRLLDHLERRTLDLSGIEMLVLDEADRMFDMGFINDVRKIVARVPARRQTLLFSATMSKEVRGLVASIQKNPVLIEIGERRLPVETVRETFYTVPRETKLGLLLHMLRTQPMESVLVFVRTKHGADKIARRLERNGLPSVALHSNRTQAQRERALAGFRRRQYSVMVATDIAARGIDVEGISHVINYDTPAFAEDYIHRIGRTARAEAAGDAITFVSHQEREHLRKIEHFVGRRYELRDLPPFQHEVAVDTVERNQAGREDLSARDRRQRNADRRCTARPGLRHGKESRTRTSTQEPNRQGRKKTPSSPASTPATAGDWRQLLGRFGKTRTR